MIQRIQSVYLLLVAVLNLIVFFTPLYRHAVHDPAAWIGNGMALTLTAVLILSLVAIFLYKNRVNQLKVVKLTTYIQITALGFAAGVLFSLGGFGTFLWKEVLASGIIGLGLIFLWLAGRAIKKDEELVKSMDRIR